MMKCKKGEPGPHHWVIEAAAGPNSRGECQNCHWVKGFMNTVSDPSWGAEDQKISAKVAATAVRKERAGQELEASGREKGSKRGRVHG